jgi:hypothetical protein
VKRSQTARNLGVIMDSAMNMDNHIAQLKKTCYYYLRWKRDVRPRITKEAAKVLVLSLVISRLDYCNCLLVNLPKKHIESLQSIMNYAARIICKLPYDSQCIRSTMKELHWLPVSYRIMYKVALFTQKALNGSAPEYLRDMLHFYEPIRGLRSSEK